MLRSRKHFRDVLLFSFLFCCIPAAAQENTEFWSLGAGGAGGDQGNATVVLGDHSIVVAGQFSDVLEIQGQQVVSSGDHDIFLARMTKTGELIWLVRAGGPGSDRGYGLDVDASGHLILAGALGEGSADFGNTVLEGVGLADAFVARYNTDGNALWARSFGHEGYDQAYAVSCDTGGDSFITGWTFGEVVFDADTVRNTGLSDPFVIRMSPNGLVRWATRIGGEGENRAYGIATDSTGSSYVTGFFAESLFAGGDTLASAGEADAFVLKLDAAGTPVWADRFGGTGVDRGHSITFDRTTGLVALTGVVAGAAESESFPEIGVSPGGNDENILLACLDTQGAYQWVRTEGSETADFGRSIHSDGDGFFYVAGAFSGNVTIGDTTMTSKGQLDLFTAKYFYTGQPVWAVHAGGGILTDWGYAVAPDPDGHAVLTGAILGAGEFLGIPLASAGETDIYLARIAERPDIGQIRPVLPDSQYIGTQFPVEIELDFLRTARTLSFDLQFTNAAHLLAPQPGSEGIQRGSSLGEGASLLTTLDQNGGMFSVTISFDPDDDPADSMVTRSLLRLLFTADTTAPFDSRGAFSVANIDARDTFDRSLFVNPASDSLKLVGLHVWPGDTDMDGVVNQNDILPIGLYFANEGLPRPTQTIEWGEYKAFAWDPPDKTYANANGDSIVDEFDVLAIGLNWANTHAKSRYRTNPLGKTLAGDGSVFVRAVGEDSASAGWWFDIRVDGVADLYGVSFKLVYPAGTPTRIRQIDAGTLLPDPLFFSFNDPAAGLLSVGISLRGANTGVNGGGQLARVLVDTTGTDVKSLLAELALSTVRANDSRGAAIQLDVGEPQLTTGLEDGRTAESPEIFAVLSNYPNPFNPSTTLTYTLDVPQVVALRIFDASGRLVRTLFEGPRPSGRHRLVWNGSDQDGIVVASGVYYAILQSPAYRTTRKLILIK